MKWPSFRAPYIKVDCPDGPRFILRKPERAFFIVAPDWDARVKAVKNALGKIEGNLEVGIRKEWEPIVESLDKYFAELQAHYQAAYLQFAANPCDKNSYEAYARANEEIRSNEFRLREFESKTEELTRSIKVEWKEPKKALKGATAVRERRVYMRPSETTPTILCDMKKLVSEFRH